MPLWLWVCRILSIEFTSDSNNRSVSMLEEYLEIDNHVKSSIRNRARTSTYTITRCAKLLFLGKSPQTLEINLNYQKLTYQLTICAILVSYGRGQYGNLDPFGWEFWVWIFWGALCGENANFSYETYVHQSARNAGKIFTCTKDMEHIQPPKSLNCLYHFSLKAVVSLAKRWLLFLVFT